MLARFNKEARDNRASFGNAQPSYTFQLLAAWSEICELFAPRSDPGR